MRQSQVTLSTVFTVCFGVLGVAAVVYAVSKTRVAITLTLLAMLIAIALHHLLALLMRRGFRRWVAILMVGVVVLGAAAVLWALLVPPAVNQAQVLGGQLPELTERIRHTDAYLATERYVNVGATIDKVAADAPGLILHAVNAVLGLVAAGVTVLFLAVFMLIFGGPLLERVLVELELDAHPGVKRVLDNVYRSVGGYVAGITLICGINSLMTTIFLAILGMPFFLPLAILSGTSSLVPYVGSLLTSVTITILALAIKGQWHAVVCAVYFVTYGQIEGNILGPLIFRRTVHVNPLITLLSILFLGEMYGVIGAFAAIPVAAAAQIALRELIRARRSRRAVAAVPAAVDAALGPE